MAKGVKFIDDELVEEVDRLPMTPDKMLLLIDMIFFCADRSKELPS